jgi:predicted nucleic acid-binding protein
MSRIVLLDTNTIIYAYDKKKDAESEVPESDEDRVLREQASNKVKSLVNDPDVALATSPLIRYEVLRGVKHISFEEMEAVLDYFMQFEIRERDAKRAAEIFKLARDKGQSINKRLFDVFHVVCAELNDLEFESQDGDIPKIRQLLQSGND